MAPQILKSKDKELPDEIQKYVGTSLVNGKVIWHSKTSTNIPNDSNLDLDNSENLSLTGVPLIHVGINNTENQDPFFLSELALHTKGYPLVLTRSTRKNTYKSLSSSILKMPTTVNVVTYEDSFLQDTELDNLINRVNCMYCDEGFNDDDESQGSSLNSADYLSIGFDTSNAFSENLPRLIKPRKRRKKEKKFSKMRYSAGLVTLEPYMPMCFKFPDVDPEEIKVVDDDSGLSQSDYSLTTSEEEDTLNGVYSGLKHLDDDITHYDLLINETPPDHIVQCENESGRHDGRQLEFLWMKSEYPYFDEKVTASHPPQRPWISLSHPERTRPTAIFTVMCYNVLCDKYATSQLYGYCPSWALNWDYRRKGILDEIRHYGADIISLQEVETEQFFNFFLPELKRDGYDGIFSPKSRAKTMNESERKYVDGCAIFYRTVKFKLIKDHLVEFNQLAMANAEGSDDMLNRVMTKDNIGLAALFQTKEGIFDNGVIPDGSSKQLLMVCTAHIHWDPEFCDVKLIQTMMLMHELKQIVEDSLHSFRPGLSKIDPNSIPLIMCGDLNSLPDSGVIEFLTSGRISADHVDFKELGYKACLSRLSSSEKPTEFTHSFRIARAYENDIMPYTNYTYDFKGIIDYIFYSKHHMVPLGILGPLDPEWFRENRIIGCPHPHVPSDHFPLLVELELQPPTTINNMMIVRR